VDKSGWPSVPMAGLLAILILGVSLSGCGKKGDPVAYDRRPTTTVLTPEKKVDRISLHWTSGKDTRNWSLFKLERSTFDPSRDQCPTCPRPFEIIAEMSPSQACSEGGMIRCTYDDVRILPGQRYRYRLKICDSQNRCETVADSSETLY